MGNLVNRVAKRPISSVATDLEMEENGTEETPRSVHSRSTAKREKSDPDECDTLPRSKVKAKRCSKKIRKPMQSIALQEQKEGQNAKVLKGFLEFPKKEEHLKCFLKLFDDEEIQDFMWNDGCAKLIDKYLVAMVYVYFKRAELSTRNYSRLNFFAALFLAHDMEEDDEEIKQEIFPWALGPKWKRKFKYLIKRRDNLLKMMNFRSVVSNLTCLEVFELCPGHPLWLRERQSHHGGASRLYPPEDEMPYNPKGPGRSPTFCSECTMQIYDDILMQEPDIVSKNVALSSISLITKDFRESHAQGNMHSGVYQNEE